MQKLQGDDAGAGLGVLHKFYVFERPRSTSDKQLVQLSFILQE